MKSVLQLSWTPLFVACSYTSIPPEYDSLFYDSAISREYAFDFMNEDFEPAFLGEVDSASRASTNANLIVINDSINFFFVVDQMSCRSWIQDDTLWVHISRSDGFTGRGLNIKIKNGKFKCVPFYSTDVVIHGRKTPNIDIEKQIVTLDRKTFQVGDSLYGKFYMRAMVDGRERKYARGHFRTKIMKGR